MKTLLFALPFALACLAIQSARADEDAAETCLRAKVWDGYSEGWAIRTMTSTTLQSGATRNYLVTLYQGNEYRIQSCADEGSANVDILLYDLSGNVIMKDDSAGREPAFNYTPTETGTYYVVIYARELAPSAKETGVGLAVTYR